MTTKQQILNALEKTDRNLPLKPVDIARQLGGDENPRVISVQLHRLADEGFIRKKGSKSGWYITELGKLRLQISRRQTKRKESPEAKSEWARELDKQIEMRGSTTYGLFLKDGKMAALATKTGSRLVLLRAGHASIQITLDTYSHVAPGLQQAAANRFDDIVNQGNKKAAKETIR